MAVIFYYGYKAEGDRLAQLEARLLWEAAMRLSERCPFYAPGVVRVRAKTYEVLIYATPSSMRYFPSATVVFERDFSLREDFDIQTTLRLALDSALFQVTVS